MEKFHKHISGTEKAVAVFLYLLFLLSIVTQLFFAGDVLLLIILLAICAAVYSWLTFLPEIYELREESLAVVNEQLRRSAVIPYTSILHIDTVGTFRSSKRDLDTVEVILKYRFSGMKRVRSISCHPKDVQGFVKLLQARCPNLIPDME